MPDAPDEIWRPSPRFPCYEASSAGRIRNVKTGRILRPAPMPSGYLHVSLSQHTVTAHTVILEAFRGPRPAGCQASHLDGDRTNNRIENLIWETALENNRRKREHGTQPARANHPLGRKTHCKWGHP